MLLALLAAAPEGLPARLDVKTPSETFGASHQVVLRDGRLWWRRTPRVGVPAASWLRIPPEGLPTPRGRLEALKEAAQGLPLAPALFNRPSRLTAISADGDNLVAVSDEGVVYYTKLSTLDWTDTWGPPVARGPLKVDAKRRGLAMSHRKVPYEDIDGNPHPVSAGVTTLYQLSGDGLRLSYADPWLPPRFERAICLPERGRFVAEALSASASTIFVMDAAGRSFTRLADFDTLGDDPALPYSYRRERRSGARAVVRSLPAEDWRAQPAIPGKHTTRLTVLQTGATNNARELRVEGEGGFWRKLLAAPAWTFVPTGIAAGDRLVQPGAVARGPARDVTLKTELPLLGAAAELRQFNPDCSPAVLHLTRGTEVLDLPLPFHGGIELLEKKERDFRGALLLPAGKGALLTALRALALGQRVLEVELDVGATGVTLQDTMPVPRFAVRFAR